MLKAHIYRILKGAPHAGIIVAALRTELSVRLTRAVGEAELADALADMRSRAHLRDDTDEMTGDPVVSLTLAGGKAAAKL